MSTAEHAGSDPDDADRMEQSRRGTTVLRSGRLSTTLSWIQDHRRESAAAIITVIVGMLLLESPSIPATAEAPEPNLDSISELFAELDSARQSQLTEAAQPSIRDATGSSFPARKEHNASFSQGDPSGILRIPTNIGSPAANSNATEAAPLSSEPRTGESPPQGRIRFSGLLRTAD